MADALQITNIHRFTTGTMREKRGRWLVSPNKNEVEWN